jgi:hypothetical protein
MFLNFSTASDQVVLVVCLKSFKDQYLLIFGTFGKDKKFLSLILISVYIAAPLSATLKFIHCGVASLALPTPRQSS